MILSLKPQRSGRSAIVHSTQPDTNLANDPMLNKRLILDVGKNLLLYWPLRKIPYHLEATDSRIGLFVVSGSVTVDVYRIVNSWTHTVTWNNRLTYPASIPWTNPGGDYDATPILEDVVLSGTNAWGWMGSGEAAILDLLERWRNESYGNHGIVLVPSAGSATFYSMDENGNAWTDLADTELAAEDRTTKYHPTLEITGAIGRTGIDAMLAESSFAVEPRATRWSLFRSTSTNPATLEDTVPYLTNPQFAGDLVKDWSFSRSRNQLAGVIEVEVDREGADDFEAPELSREFWYPMEIVQIEARGWGSAAPLRFAQMAMAVIESDREKVEGDLSTITLSCRDTGIYGLIDTFEGKFRAETISFPTNPEDEGVALERDDSNPAFLIFRHRIAGGEFTHNWVSDPAPFIYVGSGDERIMLKDGEQVQILHGLGEVRIEIGYFEADIDDGGLGDPADVFAVYQYYTPPTLDYFDSMPVNRAILRTLKDCGYQHVENTGFCYIEAMPPLLGDFVFDKVYKFVASGSVYTDVSNAVQKESGEALFPSVTFGEAIGDGLVFKLHTRHGKFNWASFVAYRKATSGTFVWQVLGPGAVWNTVAAYTGATGQPDPELAWLRGTTDVAENGESADQFRIDGLVTLHESLTGPSVWEAQVLAGTDGLEGFWMRVVATAAPAAGESPIAHRFAGKEVLVVGQDRQSNTFTHADELAHLDLCQQLIDRWGVPSYVLIVDRYGDIRGQYIRHKETPDYTLENLESIEEERNSQTIFTRVVTRVWTNRDETMRNYAAVSQGGVATHPAFTFVDRSANSHTSTDFYTYGGSSNPTPTAQQQLNLAIDGDHGSLWGIRYRRDLSEAPPRDSINVTQMENRIYYQVDFEPDGVPTAIKLLAIQIKTNTNVLLDIEGFFPEENDPEVGEWRPLFGCTNLFGSKDRSRDEFGREIEGMASKKGRQIDFTVDGDAELPIISKVRIRLKRIYDSRGGGGRSSNNDCYFWLYELMCFGVTTDIALQGEAVLGETPPFDTTADQDTYRRYGRRTFFVDQNPYISSVEQATQWSKNVLRELYRLTDPKSVRGTYPTVEIGETVRVVCYQMGIDKSYVVERVSSKPGFRQEVGLVPYRFSQSSPPETPVVPNRFILPTILVPFCDIPFSGGGGGGGGGGGLLALYRSDEQVSYISNLVSAWGDLSGVGGSLEHSSPDAPLILGNELDGKPVIETSVDQQLVSSNPFTTPLHGFLVVGLVANSFGDNEAFITFGGSQGLQVAWGQDQGTFVLRVGNPAVGDEITVGGGVTDYVLVEFVANGAFSKIAVNGGSFVTGDLGIAPSGAMRIGHVVGDRDAFWAHIEIYNGERTSTERTARIAAIQEYWGLA